MKSKLAFDWDIVRYNNSELALQILFEEPKHVSQGIEQDVLVVRMSAPDVFMDSQGRSVPTGTEIRKKLGSQTAPAMKETVGATGSTAAASLGTNLAINAILNV